MENTQPSYYPDPQARDDAIVTKAVFRAGEILHLTQKEMSQVLGVSEPTLSRRRRVPLASKGKEGEIALIFLRIFRSLDALFGGREADIRKWFDAHNHYLNGTPRALVKTLPGLFDVVTYLDAMRGQV